MERIEVTTKEINKILKIGNTLFKKKDFYWHDYACKQCIVDLESQNQIDWFEFLWILLNKILEKELSPNITVEKINSY